MAIRFRRSPIPRSLIDPAKERGSRHLLSCGERIGRRFEEERRAPIIGDFLKTIGVGTPHDVDSSSSMASITHPDRKTRRKIFEGFEDLGHEGFDGLDPVRSCSNRHNSNCGRNLLPLCKTFVNGKQGGEAAGGKAQQFAVFNTRPTLLLNGAHLVADEQVRKLAWQTFIEQNTHVLPKPAAPTPERRRLARE